VADIESGAAVSADTAFYIASATKSFTALAMNVLHHRGEIDLDATLAEYAPDAPFSAATRSGEVTLRDLLTHTSGLVNDALVYRLAFSGEHEPATEWRLLAATSLNESAPLATFQYTNAGYNILTVLTDRHEGRRWQDILKSEVFDKAGMVHTSATMSEAESWSLAKPHETVGPGAPRRMALEKRDATMQSAGGIIMSSRDAMRWLELMVEDGRIGGKQVIPEGVVREVRAPIAEVGDTMGEYTRDHYGLGWYVGRYRDDVLVHHFGGFAGARAHISFMPERKIGVAVFVNDSQAGFNLVDAIANFVYDAHAGRADAESRYAAALERVVVERDKASAAMAADRQKRAQRSWRLALPRESYAGAYANELGGTLLITNDGDALLVAAGVLHATAEPFTESDSMRVELVPGQGEVLRFAVKGGEVRGMTYRNLVFGRQDRD
ncbi:MAG TPA: serine hydrolase domain-containing protein, partial [Polyangiaceae bacterium]|nr:serine hydrolase domain-containing protein [Polyangiaceae bacterium]